MVVFPCMGCEVTLHRPENRIHCMRGIVLCIDVHKSILLVSMDFSWLSALRYYSLCMEIHGLTLQPCYPWK
jgi:hypothetical protein